MKIYFLTLKLNLLVTLVYSASINLTFQDGSYAKWADFPSMKPPVESAKDLWANTLYSPQQIEVEVVIEDFDKDGNPATNNVLAYTLSPFHTPTSGYGMDMNALYTLSLYEKITDHNYSSSPYDFTITFNSKAPWFTGVGPGCVSGFFDMMTTAIHEFAHGFGLESTARRGSGTDASNLYTGLGDYDLISIYDKYVEDLNDNDMFSKPRSGSSLYSFLTSSLRFNGTHASAANSGTKIRLHTPVNFVTQSSIDHFSTSEFSISNNADRAYYANAIPGECHRTIGSAIKGLMFDIGWGLGNGLECRMLDNKILAYPNPSSGKVELKISNENALIEIINVQGVVMLKTNVIQGHKIIDITDFQSGTYFVRDISSANISMLKIIKL